MPSTLDASASVQRLQLLVRGTVQGVGFRPFVYKLASTLGLAGFVRNDGDGVTIEVEGAVAALEAFEQALTNQAPPLARIDAVRRHSVVLHGDSEFVIDHSRPGTRRRTLISPDVATCDDCLRELFDPGDRRYRYPFTNCTNCGPRFTIIQDLPYDRPATTMSAFALCPACRAEYDSPLDRRFHAQPNACADCGPRLRLLDATGQENTAPDPIQEAARRLARGSILAIKGLGGYHLACAAFDEAAVERLRRRKQRPARPFAVMAPDVATVRRFCSVDDDEADLLQSRRRPIVLLDRAVHASLAPSVAPRLTTLGVMLPYTPLHALLLAAFAGCLVDPAQLPVLVMTSGNSSDAPIAFQEEDAWARLAPLVDGWLIHNRPIHVPCDDSVIRSVAGGEQILRRARGYVPEPIRLPQPARVPILACGAHLKNTFCLVKGQQAFVSQHIGDLGNLETYTAYQAAITHFQQIFDTTPRAVAFDLHPDYLASSHARARDIPHKIGVQHHHAHIAGVLAEHGLTGPVIGVAADGTGYGPDGAVWGGEVLVADLCDFERRAHLTYAPMPGGEQAIRQPWRMAAVYLAQAHGGSFSSLNIAFVHQIDEQRWRPLAQMVERNLNSPPTSSLGRLFDAVAALLDVRQVVDYEGQAAIELEMLAEPSTDAYPFAIDAGPMLRMNVAPTLRALVADLQHDVPRRLIAGRFHHTVALMLSEVCRRVRHETGLQEVALSGGVFQNRLLLEQLLLLLEQHKFRTYINRRVPPNDGGLSLGQAAIAAARLAHGPVVNGLISAA